MPPRLRRLSARLVRRRGASYSLPLVLVAPLYLLFVLSVFEIGMLMLARIGAGYAAHAAARSAAVWEWDEPGGPNPRLAAWAALAPFVGAGEGELAAAGPVPGEAAAAAADYADAFRGQLSADAAGRKFRNAAARTRVSLERIDASGTPPTLRATVSFRAPLRLPGVSRFIDPDRRWPFEYTLSATVDIPMARPETPGGNLGIPYPVAGPRPGGSP